MSPSLRPGQGGAPVTFMQRTLHAFCLLSLGVSSISFCRASYLGPVCVWRPPVLNAPGSIAPTVIQEHKLLHYTCVAIYEGGHLIISFPNEAVLYLPPIHHSEKKGEADSRWSYPLEVPHFSVMVLAPIPWAEYWDLSRRLLLMSLGVPFSVMLRFQAHHICSFSFVCPSICVKSYGDLEGRLASWH